MNEITKIALMSWVYKLEKIKNKNWVDYVLMDAAYITLNEAQYPYKGYLSKRFMCFAAKIPFK